MSFGLTSNRTIEKNYDGNLRWIECNSCIWESQWMVRAVYLFISPDPRCVFFHYHSKSQLLSSNCPAGQRNTTRYMGRKQKVAQWRFNVFCCQMADYSYGVVIKVVCSSSFYNLVFLFSVWILWPHMQWTHIYKNSSADETLQRSFHTLFVSLDWKDQGWGNRKGMISIVDESGSKAPLPDPATLSHQSPCVLSGAHPAPHLLEPLRLSFMPMSHGKYALWTKTGGGGGHSLEIQNCRLTALQYVNAAP
jgi:hypothetical protein